MPQTHLLPAEYQHDSRFPLSVGTWVWYEHYATDDPEEEVSAYLWRIEERMPGQYCAVAYGYDFVLDLTPENSSWFYSPDIQVSDRFRLDQHPEELKWFHDQRIMAVIHELGHGKVALFVYKRRQRAQDIELPAILVPQLQQDDELRCQWLAQILWILKHPQKANALGPENAGGHPPWYLAQAHYAERAR